MDRSSANTWSGTVTGIVVIASDDTFAHAYPDERQMIENGFGGADPDRRGGLEFFTADGRRLLPVFGPDWRLENLADAGDKPDPDLLRRRLAAVVEHVVAHLRTHPELVESSGLTLDEVIAELPRPAQQVPAEILATFGHGPRSVPDDGTITPFTSGGYFHNALHAAGWAH